MQNTIYTSNSCGKFEVIACLGNKQVIVRFLETGHVRRCNIDNARAGKVKDPYQRSRYSVGYLGEGYKRFPWHKQAKQLWSNVLKRCYYAKDPRGYYGRGVEVDPRWHCFTTFCDDIQHLKGFSAWLAKERMELDKDALGDGKTYSREVCQFVTAAENRKLQGNYRIGRVFDKERRVWVSASDLNT